MKKAQRFPWEASVSGGELTLSAADLLLAPEAAEALGLPDLAGADVGDISIAASVTLLKKNVPPASTRAVGFEIAGDDKTVQ